MAVSVFEFLDITGTTRSRSLAELRARLAAKSDERERILSLYRRAAIDDATLDRQLESISGEEAALAFELADLEREASDLSAVDARIKTTEQVLADLGARLTAPISWELKRQFVEILVDRIEIKTGFFEGSPQFQVVVAYRFDLPSPRHVPNPHKATAC